jgi:hypothetical protein
MMSLKTLLAFAFAFATTISFSQEWKKFHSEEGFDFYIKYSECHFNDVQDQSWALIKVENTNSFDAEINFYFERYMDGKCVGCGNYDQENLKTVKIPAGTSKEGKCRPDSRRRVLEVFHKFTLVKAQELTDLKIVQFKSEKTKIK